MTGSPLHVMAFTGGASVPAARFRVRQYAPALAAQGIALEESYPSLGAYPPQSLALRPAWAAASLLQRVPAVVASRAADVVLLQREMLSTLYTLEGLTGRPRVLDVDDAIHLFRGGQTAQRLAGACDLVIAGNPWLAEVYGAWNRSVAVLPTAVDTDALPAEPYPTEPVVGWIGTSGNLRYLYAIESALAAVLERFNHTRLLVCCDGQPTFTRLPMDRVEVLPWSPGVEPAFFARITAGLMPLEDGAWERGKCAFKMLQYMASARPVVVSPVGMNADVLAHGEVGYAARDRNEWVDALSSLLVDPDRAAGMGRLGRAVVEAHYSLKALAPKLAALLRGVAP